MFQMSEINCLHQQYHVMNEGHANAETSRTDFYNQAGFYSFNTISSLFPLCAQPCTPATDTMADNMGNESVRERWRCDREWVSTRHSDIKKLQCASINGNTSEFMQKNSKFFRIVSTWLKGLVLLVHEWSRTWFHGISERADTVLTIGNLNVIIFFDFYLIFRCFSLILMVIAWDVGRKVRL